MISWTDYEDNSVDSRNDYQIIHTPNGGLADNEILVHELTISEAIIKTVIINFPVL